MQAAQCRDGLQIHSQPSFRQAGLQRDSSQPKLGVESGGSDHGHDPARKVGDAPVEKENDEGVNSMTFRISQKLNTKSKAGPAESLPMDENPFADWSAPVSLTSTSSNGSCSVPSVSTQATGEQEHLHHRPD